MSLTLLTALLLAPLTVLLASLGAAVAAEGGRSPGAARERHPQSAQPRQVAGATHVIVNKPAPGRAFGWPANGGIWNWGSEILVMYLDCPYKEHPGFSNHDSDQEHPSARWMTSRSTDGGATWTEHRVAFADPRANRASLKPSALT
ncbi:MAG: hypothetical protein FJ388_13570, partial [Verrucomicrobia bacterium]|nr:hypothetical protein [Verrucomicrobiota bacterium]